MVFMLLFNISTGLLNYSIGYAVEGADVNAWQVDANNTNTQFQNGVATAPVSQNVIYQILDIVSLGLFNKIQIILNTTIFGIPALLNSMGLVPYGMMLFLDAILTIIYTIGFFQLFTSRDLTKL